MKKLFVLFFILTLSSCQKQEKFPNKLSYSFEYLNNNWGKTEIEIFKNISEKDTTPRNYHFGIGLHLRNNLLRHNAKSDSIVKYFNDLGISHYDYMSGIILTSYHRYLNKTEIRLEEQVNGIIEHLKPTVDCQNKRKENAGKLYTKYELYDSIQVKMPVNDNSVVSYNCPNVNWKFDNFKDLMIDGIITGKYVIKDTSSDNPKSVYKDYYFKLKVLKKNNPDIHYFMEKIEIGDEIEFSLENSYDVK